MVPDLFPLQKKVHHSLNSVVMMLAISFCQHYIDNNTRPVSCPGKDDWARRAADALESLHRFDHARPVGAIPINPKTREMPAL